MKKIILPDVFRLNCYDNNESLKALILLNDTNESKVAIDFSGLTETTKGDIMVLLAQIEKAILFQGKTIYRFGKLPQKKSIKDILKQMTGVKHIQETLDLEDLPDKDKEKYIDVDFIDSTVADLKKIGIKEYYIPFNEFLTELIANAVEHGIKQKNINWWLTYDSDLKNRTRRFTFVDMGVGIAKSHRNSGLPLKYYFQGDAKIVSDSFYGKLISSTKKENRGKGLPQLFKIAKEGLISDLIVITNRVSLSLINGELRFENNSNFEGTYFSWTLNQENFSLWKKLK
jgi:hypothetical protein